MNLKRTVIPKVSVIVPLHNKEEYIAETIQSVIAQDVNEWELIIVENGSSDNGVQVVKSFSDKRISLVESPSKGPGAARNFGLSKACGEWILFLDADDIIEPEHLSRLIDLVRVEPNNKIVVGGWKHFEDGSCIYEEHYPAFANCDHDELLARSVALAPWVIHAAIINRSLFKENKCFWPETLDSLPDEDTAFWFSLLIKTNVSWSPSFHAVYRMSTPSNRSNSGSAYDRLLGYLRILQYNVDLAENSDASLNKEYAWFIASMLETSYRKASDAGDSSTAQLAVEHATFWLCKCPNRSMKILARKILGLERFNTVRNAVKNLYG